jgi:protein-S-isoprenylcysteine O-methyltransferase Ste14
MQSFFDAIISAVGIAIIAQYTWSMRAHFASSKMPVGAMALSALVIVSLIIYLYLQWMFEQPVQAQIVGLLLEAASLALFWAAIFASREARLLLAFDEKHPHGLVSIGPYKVVRHPFYLSYLIFWTGWAVATWHLLALLPLVLIFGVYVMAAVGEERKFANSPLAEAYREYKARTGFLWPKING